jgi:hypothetical protein
MKKHGDGMGDTEEPLEAGEDEKKPATPVVTEKQTST